MIRKSHALYRYYDPFTNINPQYIRQIKRYNHDPIRYYEGSNENVSIKTIKVRRLG
jgi:hypothetical protein